MELQPTHKYDDIIDLPHPVTRQARMRPADRAAQFAPFAALTGYGEVIGETARQTEGRIEPEEGMVEQLNEALRCLQEKLPQKPEITVIWFRPDARKEGGAYITTRGRAKKLCIHSRTLLLEDGSAIPLEDVIFLELTEQLPFADSGIPED